MLLWEKELLGLYVTGRPVDKYRDELGKTNSSTVLVLKQEATSYHDKTVSVAGEIVSMRKIYTRNNDAMGVIQIEDWHDSAATIEAVLFPRTWNKVMAMVESEELSGFDEGTVVLLGGKFDTSRGDPQIIVDAVTQNFSVMEAQGGQPTFSDHEPAWLTEDETASPNLGAKGGFVVFRAIGVDGRRIVPACPARK